MRQTPLGIRLRRAFGSLNRSCYFLKNESMGISSLKQLIGEWGVRRHLSAYKGKRAGMDISIWLYQFIYRDAPNPVLEGLLKQLVKFRRFGVIPIYVFDGSASSEVKIEVERRKERREKVRNTLDTLGVKLEETLELLGDPVAAGDIAWLIEEPGVVEGGNITSITPAIPFEELDVPMFTADSDDEEYAADAADAVSAPAGSQNDEVKQMVEESEDLMLRAVRIQSRIHSLQKQVRRPSRDMVTQCKRVLELLGVPYRQSVGESDTTLAEMMARGECDVVFSEDTDMLPYGCETFVTGFKDSGGDFVVEFSLSKVLEKLALSREQFVDMCILCGCDYADKITKIAVKGAFDMIRRHGSIEAVLAHIGKSAKLVERHPYPADFEEQFFTARNMFLRRNARGEEGVVLHDDVFHEAEWNFGVAAANAEEYVQFLRDNNMHCEAFAELCRRPIADNRGSSSTSASQTTLLQFFKK